MAIVFVRQSKRGDWEGVTKETPEDLSFPADVLADVFTGGDNEISVWEIDDSNASEMGYVAAALHGATATNLSDMTFRVISQWRVDELNLPVRKTKGESLDNILNGSSKHWIIQIRTVGDAIKLAKAFKDRDEITYSQKRVMQQFAVSLQEGRISSRNISSELWKKLVDGKHLQVLAELPQTSGAMEAPVSHLPVGQKGLTPPTPPATASSNGDPSAGPQKI